MEFHKPLIISVVLVLELIQCSRGHISLTFPPARQYALDFLDNHRTNPPCGMPKGNIRTSLCSGSTFNVTWRMGFMHEGNYQIELLNSNESKLMDLFSWHHAKNKNKITEYQEITLPKGLKCQNCTIRLLRLALEFSNDYIFWSCSDVDIMESIKDSENCLGNGQFSQGNCHCNKGFVGSRCQYEVECDTDTDCGNNAQGKCVDIGEKHQCFCKYPYFGLKCSKNSGTVGNLAFGKYPIPDSKTLNLTNYSLNVLSDNFDLYHKIISTPGNLQIEFVLVIKGTSYGALGWRPYNLNKSCKARWPKKNRIDKPLSNINTSERNSKSPKLENGIVEAFKNEIKEMFSRPLVQLVGSSSILTHEIQNAPFKAMDCTDIVIGTAIGEYSRIRDYYTMDRSTPQLDEFWGGNDDLIGATGWESDSKTTLIFLKNIVSVDPVTDHNLFGDLHVIWSRGQELLSDPTAKKFYTQDDIKYHGYGGKQRGFTRINFLNL